MQQSTFELAEFLPFLLNEAAEEASQAFRRRYEDRYKMLRTECRLLFSLGKDGPLTARDVCKMARVHKTKVSRAVTALEDKKMLTRTPDSTDKRREWLELTPHGREVYQDLVTHAQEVELELLEQVEGLEGERFKSELRQIARMTDA